MSSKGRKSKSKRKDDGEEAPKGKRAKVDKEEKKEEKVVKMEDEEVPYKDQMVDVDGDELAGWKALTESKEVFVAPKDWPPAGDIDLAVHDLPHASSDTEWWYVNGHAKTSSGKEYSYFASFFRIVKTAHEDGKTEHSHSVLWAVVDPATRQYHFTGSLDHDSAKTLAEGFEKGEFSGDKRLHTAYHEIVKKGKVPLPDLLMKKEAKVSLDKLNLDYEGNTFVKNKDGSYTCKCFNKEQKVGLDLTFKPQKKPIRHGHDGAVKIGLKQDTMFYYFIPRCEVKGNITVNSRKANVTGEGWYDHEFGGTIKVKKKTEEKDKKAGPAPASYGWNWIALQLDNGMDITASTVVDSNTKTVYDNFAITIDKDSARVEYPDIELRPRKVWQSCRTTHDYPCVWTLTIPKANIELELEAAFPNQEFITLISKPAFWEGRLHIRGKVGDKTVTGLGFLERHGFQNINSLDTFFKRVSGMTQRAIREIMPLDLTPKKANLLFAEKNYEYFLDDVNLKVLTKGIIEPIREIVDRGGKSWRSFAFLLCMDAVGGDSHDYGVWLAMPELMHVGSLIVDDIQDKSDTRRGGAACHIKHGDAVAINAGTAAYFVSMNILEKATPNLTPDLRLKMYDLYFLTLRAGHAGQALDIFGKDYQMDELVATGNGNALENSVIATHRLKSAAPAGNLARMGAIIGRGTPEQTERLGNYFEAVGVAFQIIDDVLNLRGFEGKTKNRGEDINAGKVTFPVAKALGRLNLEQRKWLWSTIKAKPQDQKVVEQVIEMLEKCDALEGSVNHAKEMVNKAWTELDACLEESFYKLQLRAFGLYVLDRHY